MSVVTVIPMTVEEALKAADSYSHLAINGSMVQVLAAEVRRLRQLTRGQTFVTETTPLETGAQLSTEGHLHNGIPTPWQPLSDCFCERCTHHYRTADYASKIKGDAT